jgi:ankyrin repeat protein/predicted small lipoprotein YifL
MKIKGLFQHGRLGLIPTAGILSLLAISGCGKKSPPPTPPPQVPVQAQPPAPKPQAAVQETMTLDTFLKAAFDGSQETINRGIDGKFDCNAADEDGRTAMMLAAFNGHAAIVERLLKAGAKVDAVEASGRTALMFAATGSSPETVQLLLKNGAAVNKVDLKELWTPLMFAAAEGQTEIVKILLANGADRSLKDKDGDTALQFALQRNQKAVVDLLKTP